MSAEPYPYLTPREAAVVNAWHHLGDAARRGLHVSERVAARQVALAHARARALTQALSDKVK